MSARLKAIMYTTLVDAREPLATTFSKITPGFELLLHY